MKKNPETVEEKQKRKDSNLRQSFVFQYAREAFLNVKDTVLLYRKYNVAFEHELYHTFISSIVLTYARPFSSGKHSMIGSLPPKYEAFDDAVMKQTHDGLMFSRNSLYAHTDFGSTARLVVTYRKEPNFIVFQTGHTNIKLRDIIVPSLDALLDIQLARTKNDLQEKIPNALPMEDVARIMKAERSNETKVTFKHPSYK